MSDLPGFRWLPGMLGVPLGEDGRPFPALALRVRGVLPDGSPRFAERAYGVYVPDWTDPLTALGLLVLVREAWGDPTAHVVAFTGEDGEVLWEMVIRRRAWGVWHKTETEALKAALAAAPRKG